MKHASPSCIANLAAYWRALALMFAALAWQITRREGAATPEICRKAEALEIGLRAALIQLSRQIAEASNHQNACEDDPALKHLRAMAVAMLMLAALLQAFRQRLRLAGWAPAEGCEPVCDDCERHAGPRVVPSCIRPSYIDPG